MPDLNFVLILFGPYNMQHGRPKYAIFDNILSFKFVCFKAHVHYLKPLHTIGKVSVNASIHKAITHLFW